MSKEKTKVYLYTRVSTLIQVDGYSLDAQKSKMKAFCEYNDYEIAGEYEDAGKSGKSIEGRIQFNGMLEDINSLWDGAGSVEGANQIQARLIELRMKLDDIQERAKIPEKREDIEYYIGRVEKCGSSISSAQRSERPGQRASWQPPAWPACGPPQHSPC